MKPTHTGRLKNIQELIEALINDSGMNAIGKEYLSFLSDNEGSIIEVEKCKNRFENDDFGFVTEMFSKLIPIKPNVEIPDGDFWVDTYYAKNIKVIKSDDFYLVQCGSNDFNEFKKSKVQDLLNNGTWQIVPEPKKETRPFTDEEWKTWFLNDGVLMNKESKCLWKPSAMIEEIKFFEHYIDGDIDQPLWMDKEEVLEKFTDRHGNKFEKENDNE